MKWLDLSRPRRALLLAFAEVAGGLTFADDAHAVDSLDAGELAPVPDGMDATPASLGSALAMMEADRL